MPTIIQSSPLSPILLLHIVLFLSHHSPSDAFFRPQNWSNVKNNTIRQQIQKTEVMMSDPLQSQHCQPCDSEEFPHNGNSDATAFSSASSLFRHAIPSHRLGKRHDSLESYLDEIHQQKNNEEEDAPIEFSLVTILSKNDSNNQNEDGSSNISILLGKKMRGFGKGFYNCFGGKLEKTKNCNEHDYPARGAVRELCEETGISVPLNVMEDGFVGTLNFTFEDCDVNRAMKVYLFCVFVSLSKNDDKSDNSAQPQQQQGNAPVIIHPTQIRGCDEIEPEWFRTSHDVPLHQMFADDTVWLTTLLKYYDEKSNLQKHPTQQKLMFDAWFHFHSGGTETNSMMHQYIRINGNSTLTSNALPTPSTNAIEISQSDSSNIANNQIFSAPHKYTVEQKLYHALHNNGISSPNIKEFKENWAMANSVRTFMKEQDRMKWVIDVAGGHGALGELGIIILRSASVHH